MKSWVALVAAFLALSLIAARTTEQFSTSAGPLKITTVMHAGFAVEAGGQVVIVDPAQGSWDGIPQADIILITDVHGDHLNPSMIAKVKKPSGSVIAPPAVAASVPKVLLLANGQNKSLGPWTVEAVPMYNMKRGPSEGKYYHDKGRGNGYILTYGGFRVYIAGDTEGTPEMRALKNIDVAFIPMNLPYTMTPEEAADAVKAFHPKAVYPYHYMGSDPKVFAAALAGTGIDVRLRNWY